MIHYSVSGHAVVFLIGCCCCVFSFAIVLMIYGFCLWLRHHVFSFAIVLLVSLVLFAL